jgi:outer membrane protein OmpA-like peptidoglycan-associated protein
MAKRNLLYLVFTGLLMLAAAANAQQQIRAQLFADADRAMALANDAQAAVLAPASYERAADLYRRADENLTRGRSLDDIRRDLAEATSFFAQATERTELARVSLSDPYQARQDATEAEASTYAADQWRDAEVKFADAVRRLEAGNMNRARSIGSDAEEQYRAAELTAIENNYLSVARRLIEQAEDQRVDRYAPKTLARAQQLLAEAEMRLRTDRYDTDLPRTLAREANYEARHSMYLAGRVRAVADRDLTNEELLLEAEGAIARIAGRIDLVAELDAGFEMPTAAILESIEGLLIDRETLQQRNERVTFLEDEVARMEVRLGDESEQRKVQEQIQQRFGQIAAVFTREEAQVLRRGDEIIVRMGLNFDSGSSVIKPEYFTLLRKIQTAIDVFPDSQVEVQGHTDSFGADELNRTLSEQRASAVQQYLLANMDSLGATAITAAGYGETVPLANNETPEGRTRNRRIDLLITPNLAVLTAALSGQ